MDATRTNWALPCKVQELNVSPMTAIFSRFIVIHREFVPLSSWAGSSLHG